jgi:hypothetical protein
VRARTRRWSWLRSSFVTTISGGFGPGMSDTSHHKMLQSIMPDVPTAHLWTYNRLTVLAIAARDGQGQSRTSSTSAAAGAALGLSGKPERLRGGLEPAARRTLSTRTF